MTRAVVVYGLARGAFEDGVKMATVKIRADINFINPYPRAKIRARARARNPQPATGRK